MVQNYPANYNNVLPQNPPKKSSSGKILIIGCIFFIMLLVCGTSVAAGAYLISQNNKEENNNNNNNRNDNGNNNNNNNNNNDDDDKPNTAEECEKLIENSDLDNMTLEELNELNEKCKDFVGEITDQGNPYINSDLEDKQRREEALSKNQPDTSKTVKAGDVEFKVTEIIKYGSELKQSNPDGQDAIPKDCSSKNGKFFLVKVNIKNNSNKDIIILDVKYFDESLKASIPKIIAFCDYERTKSGNDNNLAPGESATIHYLFDVPTNAQNPMLEFTDFIYTDPKYAFVSLKNKI